MFFLVNSSQPYSEKQCPGTSLCTAPPPKSSNSTDRGALLDKASSMDLQTVPAKTLPLRLPVLDHPQLLSLGHLLLEHYFKLFPPAWGLPLPVGPRPWSKQCCQSRIRLGEASKLRIPAAFLCSKGSKTSHHSVPRANYSPQIPF